MARLGIMKHYKWVIKLQFISIHRHFRKVNLFSLQIIKYFGTDDFFDVYRISLKTKIS
jgi:hypothetical protein